MHTHDPFGGGVGLSLEPIVARPDRDLGLEPRALRTRRLHRAAGFTRARACARAFPLKAQQGLITGRKVGLNAA
jgi:hypothetical protein